MDTLNFLGLTARHLIVMAAIIVGAIIATRVARWLLNRSFKSASEKLKVDPTRYKFFKNMIALVIWLFAFGAIIFIIPKFKALAITLFAGAGVFVAILGFAAQQAFSNIVSGIFIVIFKPFRVGDLIKVGRQEYGVVEDITLRHTVINSFENKRIIIPNSVISSDTIINDSIDDTIVCRWVEIGISYDSDSERARDLMSEVCGSHPKCIDVRTDEQKAEGLPKVEVRLMSFGDSSQDLRAYVWTNDPYNAARTHSDLNRAIKKRFDEEGIEIPFPYRTIVYKTDIENEKKKT